MKRSALAFVVVLLATGCGTAPKITTWKDPAMAGKKTFKKLGVFVIANDKQAGRTAERMLASSLDGTTRAIPGHTFVAEAEYKDKDTVIARLKEKGFDGAMVAHVVAVDEQKGQTSGASYAVGVYSTGYYNGFGGYWGTYAPVAYVGGYSYSEKVVQIETLLYDLDSNALVWAMQNALTNPDSTLAVIESVANKSADGLRADKFILK